MTRLMIKQQQQSLCLLEQQPNRPAESLTALFKCWLFFTRVGTDITQEDKSQAAGNWEKIQESRPRLS